VRVFEVEIALNLPDKFKGRILCIEAVSNESTNLGHGQGTKHYPYGGINHNSKQNWN